jgi:hypothetical protein
MRIASGTAERKDGAAAVGPDIAWLVEAGERYWPGAGTLVAALAEGPADRQPTGRYVDVPLPVWAADLGVGSPPSLLVDAAAVEDGPGGIFDRCDWFAAAFLHLSGAFERAREAANGPIHSYAYRLALPARVHEHAWVNRIFLLLRRMAAGRLQKDERQLFGPLPDAVFDLTHDLDAVRKTPEIRLKQGAFRLYNAARALARGEAARSSEHFADASRSLFGRDDFWMLPRLIEIEEQAGVRSTLHVYGGPGGLRRGTPLRMLMDPAYSAAEPRLAAMLRRLREGGWTIGLHPSYGAWRDPDVLRREKEAVERASGAEVTRCRQHWLRFAWAGTWQAQSAAGLTLDSTLGFNDRPGFRVGAALSFAPWGSAHDIRALPMALMDSHVYDYAPLRNRERRAVLQRYVDEVAFVRGEASFNWHVHTLSPSYGWEGGYLELLDLLAARR